MKYLPGFGAGFVQGGAGGVRTAVYVPENGKSGTDQADHVPDFLLPGNFSGVIKCR